MKKRLLAILAFAILASAFHAEGANVSYSAGHYSFTYPEGFTGIEAVADACNGLWDGFNGVFGFDPAFDRHQLKVLILADRAAFDAYIQSRIGETRSQFIFLRYANPEASELVLFPMQAASGYEAFSGPILNRQLFLQYLYSFVREPPLWIRDGFQACFEKAVWDPAAKAVSFAGYSPWLEAAKNLHADAARMIDSSGVLSAVTGSQDSASFYPQAWSFTAFLLSSEKGEYQRFLHEAFMLLEGNGGYNALSQKENTELIRNRFARFNAFATADADFSGWLSRQHTFNELVQLGVNAYSAGQYAAARENLLAATAVRPDDPIVSHYLGLCLYAEKNYREAEKWYLKALASGADVSTANWALGVNAYADKRYAEARKYLDAAKSLNPARYGEKASALLSSMPK